MKNLLLIFLLLIAASSHSQISQLQPQMNMTVTQGIEVRTYGEPLPGVHGHFISAALGEISPAKPSLFLGARLIISEPMNQNVFLVKYFIKPANSFNWIEYTVNRTGNDQNILYYTGPTIELAPYGEAGLNKVQVYWTVSMHHTTTGVITSYTFNNNGESFEATYTVVGLIPVTLFDFKVSKANDLIRLNWRIGLEINFKEFQVERSTDRMDFKQIGTVISYGSSAANSYEFNDESSYWGTLYYRLKLVDKDGNFSYSQTKSITMIHTLKVGPNPVNTVLFIFDNDANGMIEITDASGKLFIKQRLNNNAINVSRLSPGNYFLRIMQGNKIKYARFIKL